MNKLTYEEAAQLNEAMRKICKVCIRIRGNIGPSHAGKPDCESGSIASGGQNSHCSCDICF